MMNSTFIKDLSDTRSPLTTIITLNELCRGRVWTVTVASRGQCCSHTAGRLYKVSVGAAESCTCSSRFPSHGCQQGRHTERTLVHIEVQLAARDASTAVMLTSLLLWGRLMLEVTSRLHFIEHLTSLDFNVKQLKEHTITSVKDGLFHQIYVVMSGHMTASKMRTWVPNVVKCTEDKGPNRKWKKTSELHRADYFWCLLVQCVFAGVRFVFEDRRWITYE